MGDLNSPSVHNRARSLRSSVSNSEENSFATPCAINDFSDREKFLKNKRNAAINLKSFAIQSLISAACFAEFYHRPFDVFIKQRILICFYVWVVGVVFLASSCLCFLYYVLYRCSTVSSSKDKKLLSPQKVRWSPSKVSPKHDSKPTPSNASFNCVRLSPQTSVLSPSVSNTSNLNISRSQSARFNASGHRHNSMLDGSFTRDGVQANVLTPNTSLIGNTSLRSQQFYQGSTGSRKPGSVFAAAEQVSCFEFTVLCN